MMSAILSALQLLVPAGPIEIRALVQGRMLVQRFATHEPATVFAVRHDPHSDTKAVYVVMNPFDATGIEQGKGATDAVVTARRWLLIDVDPVRPADTNSTDEELHAAATKARDVEMFLNGQGWPLPIRALSGNGAHLLYRIDLPNDAAARRLIEGVLRALATRFDGPSAHVDTAVFNAARITKLYGTTSRKGPATLERPHRRSELRRVPDPLLMVTREQLESLAGPLTPPQPAPARETYVPGDSAYDLGDILTRLAVRKTEERSGATWYHVRCPWSDQHSTDGGEKESALVVQSDGALGFKCFHSHCSHRRWEDVRNHLGIDTKAWKERDRGRAERPALAVPLKQEREPGEDDDQPAPPAIVRAAKRVTVGDRAKRAALITRMNEYARTGRMPGAIDTGMKRLSGMLLGGFRPGKFYGLGGESGRGKTTLLLQWAIEAARQVGTVGIITPEMDDESLDERALSAKTGFGVRDYRDDPGRTSAEWGEAAFPQNIRASFDATDLFPFVEEERPDMLIVDYAQQAVSYESDRRHTALAQLGADCLAIAKQYRIPVLLGSQVNRSPEGDFKLRETSILEHQMDALIYIDIVYAKETDGAGNRTIKSSTLWVYKHRHGPAGRIPIDWQASIFKFKEV